MMFIRIDARSGVPISRQIADQVRAQIASKALGSGDRLPSVRELARELAVNQNTVLHVYERLTMEGLLERRHGSGTFVAREISADTLKACQLDQLSRQVEELAYKAATLGVSAADLRELVDQALRKSGREAGAAKGRINE